MQTESVFRFMAVRSSERRTRRRRHVAVYGRPERQTDLYRNVLKANEHSDRGARLSGLAARQEKASEYLSRIDDLELAVRPLLEWALDNSSIRLGDIDLPTEIQRLFGTDPAALVTSSRFQSAWKRLADTVLTDSLSRRGRTPERDDYVTAIKLLSLIEDVALTPASLEVELTLHQWLRRTVVVLPRIDPRRTAARSPDEPPEPPDRPDVAPVPPRRLQALESARDELLRVVNDADAFVQPARGIELELKDAADVGARAADLRARAAAVGRTLFEEPARMTSFASERARAKQEGPSRRHLTRAAVTRLSDSTREVLDAMGVDPERANPLQILPELDRAIAETTRLVEPEPSQTLIRLGGATLEASKVKAAFGRTKPGPSRPPDFGHVKAGCGFASGIGDLLIVRQTLKAYELSDFAHVENVLAGESREREHRRLNLREEVVTEEEETETQKDRDLQTTERNEMQSEAEKTITNEFGMEAGLQLSGSYGPTVSFSSSLTVGFSSTTEETQRESVSFAREITEKTSERTRERLRKEHMRRVLEQVEETNRHSINNADASVGHIRGIYRWLNKVYDAQVFNYGQRMMFDFIVPEPAAYFLYALVENPPTELEIEKPAPPVYNGRPLRPEQLRPSVAQSFISRYRIQDAPVYPPSIRTVSHFDGLEDTGKPMHFGRGTKISIPGGYGTRTALISSAYGGANMDGMNIFVGGLWHVPIYDGATAWVGFQETFTEEISFTVYCAYLNAYSIGVDLVCTLNEDGVGVWQHAMYESIVRRYETLKAEYDEKLAALEIQKGVEILGRNPLENRRIERDELKKIAIMMLTDDPDPSLDAFEKGDEPVIDIDHACAASSRIRFLESAFEWRNMTYVHYPYFWGRKARWISALHLTDPDPDFAAFLKAGAARVQVPVRPGFEKAIAYFCQTGKFWNGNDPPLIEDDLYVPIIEEITEKLGGPEEGEPYPPGSEPWEVRTPTSLVLLQNLDEIPGIRDVLTNQEVDIQPNP